MTAFVEKFHSEYGATLCCGACGEIHPRSALHELGLCQLGRFKAENQNQAVHEHNLKGVRFEGGVGPIYNLYKRGVDTESNTATLCARCKGLALRQNLPDDSRPLGWVVDLGDVITLQLPPLTLVEKVMIARYRPYAHIVRLEQRTGAVLKLSGNTVAFPNHAATTLAGEVAAALPRADVSGCIEVQFQGHEFLPRTNVLVVAGGHNKDVRAWKEFVLRHKFWGETMTANALTVLTWLRFLKENHPLYRDITVLSEPEVEAAVASANAYVQSLVDDYVPEGGPPIAAGHFQDVGQPAQQDNEITAVQDAVMVAGQNVAPDPDAHERRVVNALLVRDDKDPVNEYEYLAQILSGSFPWLFPFGLPVPGTSKALSKDFRQHLMRHVTGRFGKETDLVFYVYNNLCRMTRARTIANVPESKIAEVNRLLQDKEFLVALESAAKKIPDERTPDESAALKKAMAFTNLADTKVPFGDGERFGNFADLQALFRHCGPASFFITVTPSAIDDAVALGLCGLSQEEIGTMSYDERSSYIYKNPVASALFFERFMDVFRAEILKIPSGKYRWAAEIQRGLFGRVFQYFEVVECQGRTLLHAHILVWTDLTGAAVEKAIKDARENENLRAFVDSTVLTFVPAEFTDKSSAWWDKREFTTGAALDVDPPAFGSGGEATERLHRILHAYQMHLQHKDGCFKKTDTCRFAMPAPAIETPTGIYVIKRIESDGRRKLVIDQMHEQVHQEQEGKGRCEPPCSHIDGGCQCEHVAVQELAPIIIATRRGEPCQRLTGFNDAITYATGANTAIIPLGTPHQSRGQAIYLCKYLSKDRQPPAKCVEAVRRANERAQQQAAADRVAEGDVVQDAEVRPKPRFSLLHHRA